MEVAEEEGCYPSIRRRLSIPFSAPAHYEYFFPLDPELAFGSSGSPRDFYIQDFPGIEKFTGGKTHDFRPFPKWTFVLKSVHSRSLRLRGWRSTSGINAPCHPSAKSSLRCAPRQPRSSSPLSIPTSGHRPCSSAPDDHLSRLATASWRLLMWHTEESATAHTGKSRSNTLPRSARMPPQLRI